MSKRAKIAMAMRSSTQTWLDDMLILIKKAAKLPDEDLKWLLNKLEKTIGEDLQQAQNELSNLDKKVNNRLNILPTKEDIVDDLPF